MRLFRILLIVAAAGPLRARMMRRAGLKAPQAPKPISIAATQSSKRVNSRRLSSKSRSGEISTGCWDTAQAGSTKTFKRSEFAGAITQARWCFQPTRLNETFL